MTLNTVNTDYVFANIENAPHSQLELTRVSQTSTNKSSANPVFDGGGLTLTLAAVFQLSDFFLVLQSMKLSELSLAQFLSVEFTCSPLCLCGSFSSVLFYCECVRQMTPLQPNWKRNFISMKELV